MKIALLAGEPSGDYLGAGLIGALRARYPQARFEGIGGERMIAGGLVSLFPMERLSVMGLREVLSHLPDLMRIRRTLYRRWANDAPAVVIGIDAPDFNLGLERRLRARGIPVVHYVSPQVWAWREQRVRKIAGAVDLMLVLFPFEANFYRDHGVAVEYTGHPLADEIALANDRAAARRALGLDTNAALVALLPGSRLSEVRMLGPLFADAARWLNEQRPDVKFVVAAATEAIAGFMGSVLAHQAPALPVSVVNGRAREVMTAADVVLLASGTASLEAMLLKRPMVVAYQVTRLTAWIGARLVRISRFALPNLLAGRELVPEFIQDAATAENLGQAVLRWLDNPAACAELEGEFGELHRRLRCQASERAGTAVAWLLEGNSHHLR